ncbi:MAG: hypothetical protein ACR2LL_00810 [Nitrosopumilus sp.]|nr:hypothetical protein [Nitrosopumilus sp.]
MSNQYSFECKFCGMDFGSDVIKLASHIGRVHDSPRGNHRKTDRLKNEMQ